MLLPLLRRCASLPHDAIFRRAGVSVPGITAGSHSADRRASFLAQRVNVLMRMVSMPVTAPSTLIPFLSTSGGQPWQPQRPLRRTLPCKLTVWTISAASATCTLKKATASLRAPSRH